MSIVRLKIRAGFRFGGCISVLIFQMKPGVNFLRLNGLSLARRGREGISLWISENQRSNRCKLSFLFFFVLRISMVMCMCMWA